MASETLDVLYMVSNAGIVVQIVLLVLVFFSITSWTIILIKYRYVNKAYKESIIFIETFWKSKNLADAFGKAKQFHSSPVARIFRTGYTELKKLSPSKSSLDQGSLSSEFTGMDTIKRALRRSITTEINRLTSLVPFLATSGNTTPFIGLFGTVWGIMDSFHGIGQKGSASLAVVAPGISEALIATAAGLAVAIPSVIAFNYFMQKIRVVDSELQNFAADFLNIIERDILRQRGKGYDFER